MGHIIHKVERPRESETSQGNAASGKMNSAIPEDLRGRAKGTEGIDPVAFGLQVFGIDVFGPKIQRTKDSLAGGAKDQSFSGLMRSDPNRLLIPVDNLATQQSGNELASNHWRSESRE